MPTIADEDDYWQSQVIQLHHDSLKNVRDTAAKWQATISALLALFGSAAFLKGADTFASLGLSAPWPVVLLAIIIVAVILAFAAVLLSAYAAQGLPSIIKGLTGGQLEQQTISTAKRATKALTIGRALGLAATLLILMGATAVLTVSAFRPADTSVSAIVKRPNGGVFCGTLIRPAALQLQVAGTAIDLLPDDAITIVPKCP